MDVARVVRARQRPDLVPGPFDRLLDQPLDVEGPGSGGQGGGGFGGEDGPVCAHVVLTGWQPRVTRPAPAEPSREDHALTSAARSHGPILPCRPPAAPVRPVRVLRPAPLRAGVACAGQRTAPGDKGGAEALLPSALPPDSSTLQIPPPSPAPRFSPLRDAPHRAESSDSAAFSAIRAENAARNGSFARQRGAARARKASGRWPGPLAGSPGHRGRAVAQYGRVWPRPSASGQQAGYVRAAPRGQVAVTGVTPFLLIRAEGRGRTGGGGYVRLR